MTYDPDRTAQVPEPSPQSTTPAPAAAPAAATTDQSPAAADPPAAAGSPGITQPAAPGSWLGRPSKRVAILIAAIALVGACCIGAAGVAIGAALFRGDGHGPVGRGFDRGEYGPRDSRHPGDMGPRGDMPRRGDVGPGWRRDDQRPPAAPPAEPAPASPGANAPATAAPGPTS